MEIGISDDNFFSFVCYVAAPLEGSAAPHRMASNDMPAANFGFSHEEKKRKERNYKKRQTHFYSQSAEWMKWIFHTDHSDSCIHIYIYELRVTSIIERHTLFFFPLHFRTLPSPTRLANAFSVTTSTLILASAALAARGSTSDDVSIEWNEKKGAENFHNEIVCWFCIVEHVVQQQMKNEVWYQSTMIVFGNLISSCLLNVSMWYIRVYQCRINQSQPRSRTQFIIGGYFQHGKSPAMLTKRAFSTLSLGRLFPHPTEWSDTDIYVCIHRR